MSFDTAENDPSKIWRNWQISSNFCKMQPAQLFGRTSFAKARSFPRPRIARNARPQASASWSSRPELRTRSCSSSQSSADLGDLDLPVLFVTSMSQAALCHKQASSPGFDNGPSKDWVNGIPVCAPPTDKNLDELAALARPACPNIRQHLPPNPAPAR